MKNYKRILIGLSVLITLTTMGCNSMSRAEKEHGPLPTADKVDIQKYMGDWYVIANIPTFLEKGAHNAVEKYTWNQEKERIDVDFHYNKNSPDGKLVKLPQKAFIENKTTNAEWKTQLFWPVKFPYVIMDLASDYSYSVVGVPDRSHVWILSRNPTMDETTYSRLVAEISEAGFDTGKIKKVPQELH